MKIILDKIQALKDKTGDNFRLGSAIAVGILLLGFLGAALYVLIDSMITG